MGCLFYMFIRLFSVRESVAEEDYVEFPSHEQRPSQFTSGWFYKGNKSSWLSNRISPAECWGDNSIFCSDLHRMCSCEDLPVSFQRPLHPDNCSPQGTYLKTSANSEELWPGTALMPDVPASFLKPPQWAWCSAWILTFSMELSLSSWALSNYLFEEVVCTFHSPSVFLIEVSGIYNRRDQVGKLSLG